MKLLSFELKKIILDKRFLYLTIILIAGVVILFMRNIIFESYIEKEESQKIETYIAASQANNRMLQNTLDAGSDDEERLKHLLSVNSQMLEVLYQSREILQTEDWQTKLQLENEFLSYVTEYKNAEGDYPLTIGEIDQIIALNQKLLQENIKPEHKTFSQAMPNFLKVVVSLLINLGAIVIILLFVGDILSSEYEQHSIGLLLTQPLNRLSIITSKLISSILIYAILIYTAFAIAILVGLTFGMEGTFNYPILIEKSNEFQFISIQDYINQSLIIICVFGLALISLTLLISLLLKHTLATFFVLLGILLTGYVITFIPWNALFWVNPFQYVLAEDMILNQNDKVWYQGIPATILLAFVCLVISLRKIKTSKLG